MAKSAAERKRLQREREAAERRSKVDPILKYAKVPFYKYVQEGWVDYSAIQMYFEHMGLEAPVFEDDSDPVPPEAGDPDYDFEGLRGSIGRAEVMVSYLISAAVDMSAIVNKYKVDVIKDRLDDLSEPASTPEEQRKALEEAMMLGEALKRLEKHVRFNLSQWSSTDAG